MRVLMISLDKTILNVDSPSRARMRDYGTICEELHIVVLGAGGKIFSLAGNIFVYPAGRGRVLSLFRAKQIGDGILRIQDGGWVITAQDPFESGFIGWLLTKKHDAALEVQLHGDFYGGNFWKNERLINRFRHGLGKFVLRRADAVRAVSRRIKNSIAGFVEGDVSVIPIFAESVGVADPRYLKNKFLGAFPIIIAAGNLIPVKNYGFLIESFAGIKKELPTAKLIIAGDGPLQENLKLQILNLKLDQDVWLAGRQKNLADFYASADIFVHSSLYEGWGRVVIEAARRGLPIVMSDVGLAGEVIKHNESGLIVPVNDKTALKNAIINLAKDEGLRKKLSEGAREAMAKLPSNQEYLNKIKEAWMAVCIN